MKQVSMTREARKTLKRMPVDVSKLILSKIVQYASDPRALSRNVARLQGRSGHRLRVGDWRVIFDEDATTVHILAIGPRGGVYG